MFSHIGFFHFVENYGDPLGELKAEVAKYDENLGNALIVLPEAFNLGRSYDEPGLPTLHRDEILAELIELSQESAISFVVGLIEPLPPLEDKPHNSAYFVDGENPRLVCHKQLWDGIGFYVGCPIAPDHNNPLILDDVTILTLICGDTNCQDRARENARTAHSKKKPQNLICIPGFMRKDWFGRAEYDSQQDFLKKEYEGNARIVVANSKPTGIRSFVTDSDWVIRTYSDDQRKNQIQLTRLD